MHNPKHISEGVWLGLRLLLSSKQAIFFFFSSPTHPWPRSHFRVLTGSCFEFLMQLRRQRSSQ